MSDKPRNNNQALRLLNDDGSEVAPRVLTVSALTTAGVENYTVAQVLGGFLNRDPNGANRIDTLPDVADLLAELGGADYVPVGQSFRLIVRNTADAAETITVSAGTGMTIYGDNDVAQNNLKEFLFVVASSTTMDVYALGSQDYTA